LGTQPPREVSSPEHCRSAYGPTRGLPWASSPKFNGCGLTIRARWPPDSKAGPRARLAGSCRARHAGVA